MDSKFNRLLQSISKIEYNNIKKMVKAISSEFDLDEFACLEIFLNELKSCLEIDKIKR